MSKETKVSFSLDDSGEKTDFYVVAQTRLNNINYLLVTDSDDDEAEALILREMEEEGDLVTAKYEIVDDDNELKALSTIFEELLEDVDIEL